MTVAVWVALAVVTIPVVLLVATAGCGSFLPAADDEVEPSENPPPATVPAKPKEPDPRRGVAGGLPTEVELKPTYASTVLGTVGLVGYWRLGEEQAELLKQQPQAKNSTDTANLNGNYANKAGIQLEVTGALSKGDDGAARFNGGYVEVPFQPVLQMDEVTLELWLKLDAPVTDWRVVAGYYETQPFNDAVVVRGFRLRARTVTPTGGASALQVQGMFGGMSTALEAEVPSGQPPRWHHVVLTYNNTIGQERAELYVDTKLAPPANGKCQLKLAAPQPLRFAAALGAFAPTFNGSLDEVAFYGQHMGGGTVVQHFDMATS
jgi:hypothetical protein